MRYCRSLDSLRCLAVLAVFALHAVHRVPVGEEDAWAAGIYRVARFGWIGVDLFFVLSGYLITRILLESRTGSIGAFLRTFYARRSLRIFPLYFVVVPLVLAGLGFWGEVRPTGWDWFGQLTYTANLINVFRPSGLGGFLGHTWSLAVEEHFYLIWPVLVWWCPRRWLVRLCVIGVLASMLCRNGLLLAEVESPLATSTPTRIGTILVGAWMAVAGGSDGGLLRRWRRVGLGAGVALVVGCVWTGDFYFTSGFVRSVGYELAALGSAGLVAWAVGVEGGRGGRVRGWLEGRVAVHLGRISYGLYLIHLPVFTLVAAVLKVETWVPGYGMQVAVLLAVAGGATYLLALLAFLGLETPFLRMKRHFEYARVPAGEVR